MSCSAILYPLRCYSCWLYPRQDRDSSLLLFQDVIRVADGPILHRLHSPASQPTSREDVEPHHHPDLRCATMLYHRAARAADRRRLDAPRADQAGTDSGLMGALTLRLSGGDALGVALSLADRLAPWGFRANCWWIAS